MMSSPSQIQVWGLARLFQKVILFQVRRQVGIELPLSHSHCRHSAVLMQERLGIGPVLCAGHLDLYQIGW